jgi:hypothetical protein
MFLSLTRHPSVGVGSGKLSKFTVILNPFSAPSRRAGALEIESVRKYTGILHLHKGAHDLEEKLIFLAQFKHSFRWQCSLINQRLTRTVVSAQFMEEADSYFSAQYVLTKLKRSIKNYSSTRTALTTVVLGCICIAVFIMTVLSEERAPLTKLPLGATCADQRV